MDPRLDAQFRFLLELDKLKGVLRQSVLSDLSRRENSAEHSWHLGVIALCLAEYSAEPVNISTVMKMLLLHDVIEIDAGDGFWHTEAELRVQAEKEHEAANRIFALLPGDQAKEFHAMWVEFESGTSAEARFARVVDKIGPALLHEATGAAVWRTTATTHSQILRKLSFVEKDAPKLWPRLERLIERALETGALKAD
jgi:putative hydrolases of HD superfamily